MPEAIRADLCVIGAGSGGLTVAAGASQMGAEVVLIESDKMGGDCLNYGCVPSKALLAAGNTAESIRGAGAFGVDGHDPAIDFARVDDHVHEIIARIAPNDSQERFERLGVRVIRARASFTGPKQVRAGDATVGARRFVVATGSRQAIEVLRWRFEENDRAQTERQTKGLIKVVITKRGRVLGISIVGPHAGELILPWVLAISQKLKIGAMANVIVPYPTLSEVSKRAAGSFYAPKLFSRKTKALVRFLARFG